MSLSYLSAFKSINYLLFAFLLFAQVLPVSLNAQLLPLDQNEITRNKSKIRTLIESLDGSNSEMREIQDVFGEGLVEDACAKLLQYYVDRSIAEKILPVLLIGSDADLLAADNVLKGKFKFQGVPFSLKRDVDGCYDWNQKGPNDDPEWAWFLNRHYCFRELYAAWVKRKDISYVKEIDLILIDWIKSNPVEKYFSLSPAWRALEAARRIEGPWIEVFFRLQKESAFSSEARILMLSSILEHGDYLMNHHSFNGNHLLTEMMALASIAVCWPEFERSRIWLDYASDRIEKELYSQTYPDGAFKELANHYQRVALVTFQRGLSLLSSVENDKVSGMRKRVELMWSYWANVMRPYGNGPLNNDSDLENNLGLLNSTFFGANMKDWRTSGSQSVSPSRYFPWAGHAVMRSDWSSDAQWAFFDVGPNGSDHQHDDRLHLSITIAAQDYLVDGGRYTYMPGAIREYFMGPRAHNVILLDGEGTIPPPDIVDNPMQVIHEMTEEYDFFSARTAFMGDAINGRGKSYHKRSIRYNRGKNWLVSDELKTYGMHKVEVLWHFHPDCKLVIRKDNSVVSNFTDKPNLSIKPQGNHDWDIQLIRGQDEPNVQGWYSRQFNKRQAATVAIYSTYISSPRTFEWLISPE